MKERSDGKSTAEQNIRLLATAYFAQSARYQEVTLEGFAAFAGVSVTEIMHILPLKGWNFLRDEWILRRLRQSMDEIYKESKTQEDFLARSIATRAGVPKGVFQRLARDEWLARRATLPTARDKLLESIGLMVQANIPIANFTLERMYATAGLPLRTKFPPWLYQARRDAYFELVQNRHCATTPPSPGENMQPISGGWVDLDSGSWDLRPAGGNILKRERLRDDFAALAWSLLREELHAGEFSVGTIHAHYQGFKDAGKALGTSIPDVRSASLETLQRAWVSYEGKGVPRVRARTGLLSIFEALLKLSAIDPALDGQELQSMVNWLRTMLVFPHEQSNGEFFSEDELNEILTCCLADIKAGIAFTENRPDLTKLSTRQNSEDGATCVVQWTVALMILLMAFTGLRRQSVLLLEVEDWVEIRAGLFVLAWHHSKKSEAHLAVLPAAIGQQLQLYVSRTEVVRTALKAKRVFLNGTNSGLWEHATTRGFARRLQAFVRHHDLRRQSAPLQLGSTIFRRTLATRALYEGLSIEALRSQFGHTTIATTLMYTRFDLFEHPSQVRAPLDVYGRQALTTWYAPLLLQELSSEERRALLSQRTQQEQDVGLCRHDHCVKAEDGSPPPCSLCEHLITGPEFLPAWQAEHRRREQELHQLAMLPGSGHILAQMKGQFDRFEANLAFVRQER